MHAPVPEPARTRRSDLPYRLLLLGLLSAVYMLNYTDRMVLPLLMPEMNRELGFSDSQIGQITGSLFPIVYSVMSIVFAILADRVDRIRLLAFTTILFSLTTAACGLVEGFWTLMLVRVGVGAGEAGSAPPSLSLIADHFEGPSRQLANFVYVSALVVGMLFAYGGVGAVSVWYGWRMGFYAAGVVIGLCVLVFLRDNRKSAPVLSDVPRRSGRFRDLARNGPFIWAVLVAAFSTMLSMAPSQWLPLYLSRSLDMSQADISLLLGTYFTLFSFVGLVLGAWLATHLRRMSVGMPQLAGVLMIVVTTLGYLCAFTFHDITVARVSLALVSLVSLLAYGSLLAYVQDVTEPENHSKASGIMFVAMALGFSLGTMATGFLSDLLKPAYGADALGVAVLPVIVASGLIAGVAYYMMYHTTRNRH
ncbi:MFS transporter [Novosphingobium sp. MBES04]|uniref:MFS transporter n=1 Tax=Novosphingobium sp. MBES04 TaxID=1206458 RepID=UPI00057D6868|nr:MFS transporter [Novosphingobium sp. MBES04]GAM05011.1 hypothetical protein MBENS4_2009 [Novosphingobium sp. MBES04]